MSKLDDSSKFSFQYRIDKKFSSDITFDGLEIPSQYTIAAVHLLDTPKVIQALQIPSASQESKSDLVSGFRQLRFNDEVTVHEYEAESDISALDSDEIDEELKTEVSQADVDDKSGTDNELSSENELPAPVFSTTSERSSVRLEIGSDEADIIHGRHARKTLQVQFRSFHRNTK